jgi:hypothetical protein
VAATTAFPAEAGLKSNQIYHDQSGRLSRATRKEFGPSGTKLFFSLRKREPSQAPVDISVVGLLCLTAASTANQFIRHNGQRDRWRVIFGFHTQLVLGSSQQSIQVAQYLSFTVKMTAARSVIAAGSTTAEAYLKSSLIPCLACPSCWVKYAGG